MNEDVNNCKGFWEKDSFWPACDYPATVKQFVKVRGVQLWVEIEGKDTPLILIHGGPGGNHCYFHPKMSGLAKRRSIIYYDLRGHYMSSEPLNPYDYGLLQDAKDLEALRKSLGLGKFDLLGHSYGGVVAVMYSLIYPNYLNSLILCSAPVDITDEEGDKLINSHSISKKMERTQSEEEWVNLYYKLYFRKPLSPETKHYQELTRRSYLTEKSQRVLKAYENDSADINWKKDILKINKPMLFLCGKYDPLALPERIKNIIANLNNAELFIFQESGHDPFVDEPEEFIRIVNEFLSSSRKSLLR